MKVTLSLETTVSEDVSIMVDALRASTTMTLALDNFEKVIPCFSPEEAFKLKDELGGVIAGERGGDLLRCVSELQIYPDRDLRCWLVCRAIC